MTGKQVTAPMVSETPLSDLHFAKDAPKGHQLEVRKQWPREGRAWDELLASVRQHGVIIPLVFKEIEGKRYVISGNRRLDVLREIHKGELATRIIAVPTIDVASYNNGDPRELAYAANISLPPHAVDRYELFSMLIDDGMSRADLAARFVLSDRQVSQVLALAHLAPEIRSAWRSEEITADAAQAFTLASSQLDQLSAFKILKKAGSLSEWAIKARFVGKQRDVGRFVAFVGADRYREAGGKLNEDLFGTDHTVTDQPLLMKLVNERFEAEIKRLTETDGWAWAATEADTPKRYDYDQLKRKQPAAKERAEITKLQKIADESSDQEAVDKAIAAVDRIETAAELEGYTEKDRARAGCVVSMGDEGHLKVLYGYIKPKAELKAEEAKASGAKPKPKKADGSVLSNALAQRLSQQLTIATTKVLSGHVNVALAVLAAGFETDSAVKVEENGMSTRLRGRSTRNSFTELFATFIKKGSLDALAAIAATALDFETLSADRPPLKSKDVNAIIDRLQAKAFNVALLKEFDAKDYFASVSGAVCAAAIKEIEPKHPLTMKGKAAAAKAATALAIKHEWLPLFLRTSHYAGPGAKKGR